MTLAPPRTLRKRERTRGELLAAAERLVAVNGLDAISIDDITEEADVAKGTFYTHFEDKDHLASAIGKSIRLELEEKITATNAGVTDAAVRMANGLSSMFAFTIAQPIRARALIRLIPGAVDPDEPINAGIKGDVALGHKTKRFAGASLNAAVVATLGIAMSAGMRLSDAKHRVGDPYAFATEILATALVALGLKQTEAARLAKTAMDARRQEAKP
ncbi:MAG: TetR/AcrR family transcriptional regulator [Micropepsaceae bacterium]